MSVKYKNVENTLNQLWCELNAKSLAKKDTENKAPLQKHMKNILVARAAVRKMVQLQKDIQYLDLLKEDDHD